LPDTAIIKITLNGKPSEIQSGTTVSDLLAKWKVRPELVTVELNENILQKLDYEAAEIRQGDVVNFVFYMGGGGIKSLPVTTGAAEAGRPIRAHRSAVTGARMGLPQRQDPSLKMRRQDL
jgi:thiamine biosynthesis protein ThiS